MIGRDKTVLELNVPKFVGCNIITVTSKMYNLSVSSLLKTKLLCNIVIILYIILDLPLLRKLTLSLLFSSFNL